MMYFLAVGCPLIFVAMCIVALCKAAKEDRQERLDWEAEARREQQFAEHTEQLGQSFELFLADREPVR